MRILSVLLLTIGTGAAAAAAEKPVLIVELGRFPDEILVFHSVVEEVVKFDDSQVAVVCTIHTVTAPLARGDSIPLDDRGEVKILYGITYLSWDELAAEVNRDDCTMADYLPHPDFYVRERPDGNKVITYIRK